MINALSSVIKEIKKFKPVQKIRKEVINLKDKIKDIMSRVSHQPTGLKNFFQSGSKSEIVVIFLAVLHLFRDEKIEFQQEKRFGEIHIKKNK